GPAPLLDSTSRGRAVAALHIVTEKSSDQHFLAAGLKLSHRILCFGLDRHVGKFQLGLGHLSSDRTLPDQVVKPELISAQARFFRLSEPASCRTYGFVCLLGAF